MSSIIRRLIGDFFRVWQWVPEGRALDSLVLGPSRNPQKPLILNAVKLQQAYADQLVDHALDLDIADLIGGKNFHLQALDRGRMNAVVVAVAPNSDEK